MARLDVMLAAMERLGDFKGINALPAVKVTLANRSLARVVIPGRD